METEIINIDPVLKRSHHDEFIKYCKKIRKEISKKTEHEKEEYLFELRETIENEFSGSNLHENIDLYFVESLMIDLLLQGWQLIIKTKKIQLVLETSNELEVNLDAEKEKTRRRHLFARNSQLQHESVFTFIKGMEKRKLTNKGWHSIFSVMRDGEELSKQLKDSIEKFDDTVRPEVLNELIKPYLQFVEAGEKCAMTGLYLSDIWRYFRHTWINEYKSLPGRSIAILIRDAASPNHCIIGIAALGSSVAQQTCRDKWIGWEGETFVERIEKDPSVEFGRWILETINKLITQIYIKDFLEDKIITKTELLTPSLEKIDELRKLSLKYRSEHVTNPHIAKFSADNRGLSWSERAQSKLYKSKRAVLLAELLLIRLILNKHKFINGTKKELKKCLQKTEFKSAIQKLIRKAKSIHVGINMMDIVVCGAIAPYNHLLGGKLVCMMLTSPEVTRYYNKKYSDSMSLIASSMNGKPVVRKPQIVMLGTTSLFGAGSSQYNRIKIPIKEIGGSESKNIEYKELGYSEGYGSFHFSSDTIWLADKIVGKHSGGKRVNSIFGEGANPLLRKLKDAMEQLKLESNPILNHRNRRVVYGISLAKNFNDVLIGLANKAKYLLPQSRPKEKTVLIARFWVRRWLQKRILREDILKKVSEHTLAYPITHGARVIVEKDGELFKPNSAL